MSVRSICTLVFTLLLSGCGTQFAYNNLTLITPWYVDDYIDLDRQQKAVFKGHLKTLHEWHRRSELPIYLEILLEIQTELAADDLNTQAISQQFLKLRTRWEAIILKSTPAIIEISQSLTDEQRTSFFQALEERNEKRLAEMDSAEEHLQESVERIEKWMGALNPDQIDRVQTYAKAYPDLTESTVAAHRAFQTELSQLMSQAIMADYPARLGILLSGALDSPEGQKLTQMREQQLQARLELFSELWATASEQQKRRVRKKLQGYIRDIEKLTQRGDGTQLVSNES
jgi:uncharacterized FlaG/YvyC family protein